MGKHSICLLFFPSSTQGKRAVTVTERFHTIAMEFWANLEHKLRYKKQLQPTMSEEIADGLLSASETCCELDRSMENIRSKIQNGTRE